MTNENSKKLPRRSLAETLTRLAKAMDYKIACNDSLEKAGAFPPTINEQQRVLDAYSRIASREVRQALLDILVSAAGTHSKPW